MERLLALLPRRLGVKRLKIEEEPLGEEGRALGVLGREEEMGFAVFLSKGRDRPCVFVGG